ncbi:glucose/sorbosone family PQQ-dependent dehydrogenase [Actinoplanes sp. N902-109]|uniref:glucose/sorbosone family PQQ-dependent dehydrogenase n=1 Tax=Actinoplanes sp. (strain N902-109) TaxID=649831 RepID=UPI00032949E2|nr:quinoprotein glucose dehydrogenase [Actinoplanes sp. N902-109]
MFIRTVVATGLQDPYEIVWGPGGQLWVTEKSGLRVTRVDPVSGARSTALDLSGTAFHARGGQDGLLGLAFHPSGRYAYVSYTYQTTVPDPVTGETRRLTIARYTVDRTTYTLIDPRTLLAGLPSSSDHQSARLRFGPDGKLYYTIGDQGANQFAYACRPNQAQRLPTAAEVEAGDWSAYQGKTLRINVDGSIPSSNPVVNGVRSHVYTYGHRNPQGMDFGAHGLLYEAEQGPKTDDEINVVQRGNNYGWPYVAGRRDDKAYVYGDWSQSAPTPCTDLTYDDATLPSTVPQQKETDWKGRSVAPISTIGTTVDNGYDFRDPACADGGRFFICYPTVAPSSLSYYRGGIDGWGRSLVVTSLKDGSVYKLGLTANGKRIVNIDRMWTSQNRYRDTAFSPDGRTIYVATDSAGLVRGADGAPTTELTEPGSILAFRAVR